MSKSNRMYKIFMTSMIVIIAGLLLATGIIAIQKQMKLKANIEFLPGINVEIYVNEESENGLLFRNFDKDTNNKIYVNSTYCELGATTLTMNNNFVTAYGNNFTLIVKNYSGFTIETNITSTATAKIGENSVNAVPAEITPPTAQIATGDSEEFVVTCEPIIPQETILLMAIKDVPCLITYTTSTLDPTNSANISGGWATPIEVAQGGSLIGKTFTISTEGYSVGVKVEGDCDYSYNPITGVLSISDIQSDIAVTAQANPWVYGKYSDLPDTDKMTSKYYTTAWQQTEFAYNSVWAGYSYIKFANDTNTRWIIIGAGGDIASSVFNKSEIDASIGNSASFALTGTQNGYTYNSKDMLAPAANPNGDLTDSQILLLREVVLDSTQYYDTAGKARWTTADGATKASLNTYLNTTFYNTGLNTYEEYIENPTLRTAWLDDSACIVYTPSENDNSRIFLMGSRYGYYDASQTYKTGAVWTSHQEKYGDQNFCIEDYIGTYVYGAHDSNPRMFYHHSPNTSYNYFSYWWLRSGYYDYSNNAFNVSADGYVYRGYVYNGSLGVRPSFVLNLA